MAKTAELRILREVFQALGHSIGAEIDPADHALNRFILRSQVQQKESFSFRLVGLDSDAARQVVSCKFGKEPVRQEIVFKQSHLVCNPGVADRIVLPEVLMGVNSHGRAVGSWYL